MNWNVERLVELPIEIPDVEIPSMILDYLMDARRQFATIECFDFVPSNYENAWRYLSSIPRGRFCEWGSGLGVVVGLAEMLGFEASGIELNALLADRSRQFLDSQCLHSTIHTGSYHDIDVQADYYYTYCWPSRHRDTKERFLVSSPAHAKLLFCDGQDRLMCLVKDENSLPE